MVARALAVFLVNLTLILSGLAGLAQNVEGTGNPLHIPAFTAYSEPDASAIHFDKAQGATEWKTAKDSVVWYGKLGEPGTLNPAVQLSLPSGESAQYRLTISPMNSNGKAQPGTTRTARTSVTAEGNPANLNFGNITITKPGYYRFALTGLAKTGTTFGAITALLLAGSPANRAQFNLTERRNAASVHLIYPTPSLAAPITAFYNEVTVKTDPVASYYMACGFRRGYFGIQVNSPTERRIIFSVWDSGNEAVDRGKVGAEDRVTLLAKGKDVVASDFGNEGTGGHSHLVYPWKTGHTYRFLVTAKPQGTSTTYTGYFYFPERKAWQLIASFRAPKDGEGLRGLYSFNENFWGDNGQQRRLAEFGPAWVKTETGTWTELTTAKFSHDGHGKANRKDYAAGVVPKSGRFYLSNGGGVENSIRYGDALKRPPSAPLDKNALP